jgi:5-methylcytosine-specific restriction endonuclease McrA
MFDSFNSLAKRLLKHHRRRARKDFAMLDYGPEEICVLLEAAHLQPCPYCGALLTEQTWEIDHVVPVSRGGATAHRLTNLQVICRRCNLAKSDLTREEFASLMHLVSQWPPVAQASVLRRLAVTPIYRRSL